MRKRGLCCWPVSVCPSVSPSVTYTIHERVRSCIVSRRLKILSNFFLGPVTPSMGGAAGMAGTAAAIPLLRVVRQDKVLPYHILEEKNLKHIGDLVLLI